MVFAHARIGFYKLLFTFYSLLRFTMIIRQLDGELDVSCCSLHRRVERFDEALGLPRDDLVGSVEINKFYVPTGKKYSERDQLSRSGGCRNVDEEVTMPCFAGE